MSDQSKFELRFCSSNIIFACPGNALVVLCVSVLCLWNISLLVLSILRSSHLSRGGPPLCLLPFPLPFCSPHCCQCPEYTWNAWHHPQCCRTVLSGGAVPLIQKHWFFLQFSVCANTKWRVPVAGLVYSMGLCLWHSRQLLTGSACGTETLNVTSDFHSVAPPQQRRLGQLLGGLGSWAGSLYSFRLYAFGLRPSSNAYSCLVLLCGIAECCCSPDCGHLAPSSPRQIWVHHTSHSWSPALLAQPQYERLSFISKTQPNSLSLETILLYQMSEVWCNSEESSVEKNKKSYFFLK